uniref:Uncharacterized protein n=1 Tax=Anguilla anguilla TaxID=7936 RepID=A0A0E9TJX1_ANGAN
MLGNQQFSPLLEVWRLF